MNLEAVLQGVPYLRRHGSDRPVSGVEYDSRRIAPASLFVAMRGAVSDGNRYLGEAVSRGAGSVVTDSADAYDRTLREHPGIAVVEVEHGRRALSGLAANFFEHPERRLAITGVTGTNGKTTTAFLLEALLGAAGRGTVLVSTVAYRAAGRMLAAPRTTPESRDLFELFRLGTEAGAAEAVMEVSSHALDQGRVAGLHFDVAIFTNLTRDHLDYHGDMESYFAAKAKLFDGSQGRAPRAAVVCAEDDRASALCDVVRRAGSDLLWTYGLQRGDFRARDLRLTPGGMRFTLDSPLGSADLETRLIGRVHALNLLAASAAGMARGLSLQQAAEGASALGCVPGRFQPVECGQDFTVIVDYAHTDDALGKSIALARELVRARKGRVITLFGCGGDRDRSKRPLMGGVAAAASDVVVLTSDNPRSEDPMRIIDEIRAGIEGASAVLRIEPDRERAIGLAIAQAGPGDLVLLAGKGHENTQTLKDRVIPFDDAAVAQRALLAGASAP